jgi:hypothetical protein
LFAVNEKQSNCGMLNCKEYIWKIANVNLIRSLRHAYNILVGKPDDKMPHGRPRGRFKDNSKVNLD